MGDGCHFSVITENLTYFLVGQFPHGPLGGLALTVWLAVAAGALAAAGGLGLGLLCVSRRAWVRRPVSAVVNVLRGLPLLMVIFWAYFLLPRVLGRPVPEAWTVIAALAVFTSAYVARIVVAGIEGVPRQQTEAALSAGLSPRQVMRFVILPQALRNMLPSFVNQFVSLIKDTSLAFIVGVSELTHVATQVNNRTMAYPAEIFLFIAVVYFLLCSVLTAFSRRLERRLAWRPSV